MRLFCKRNIRSAERNVDALLHVTKPADSMGRMFVDLEKLRYSLLLLFDQRHGIEGINRLKS